MDLAMNPPILRNFHLCFLKICCLSQDGKKNGQEIDTIAYRNKRQELLGQKSLLETLFLYNSIRGRYRIEKGRRNH